MDVILRIPAGLAGRIEQKRRYIISARWFLEAGYFTILREETTTSQMIQELGFMILPALMGGRRARLLAGRRLRTSVLLPVYRTR